MKQAEKISQVKGTHKSCTSLYSKTRKNKKFFDEKMRK